jgi:transposase
LQDEIRRSEESRYDHRLHGVLLVAQGMTCPEAGKLLGDAPRTVEYWVHEFEEMGVAGLLEGERSGRPRRLNEKKLQGINAVLRHMPREAGLGGNLWDGKTLAAWIEREYGIHLGVRQCQRLFRQLGFRLRKPRPAIAQTDPEHLTLRETKVRRQCGKQREALAPSPCVPRQPRPEQLGTVGNQTADE